MEETIKYIENNGYGEKGTDKLNITSHVKLMVGRTGSISKVSELHSGGTRFES
jgi:hypothetical protein